MVSTLLTSAVPFFANIASNGQGSADAEKYVVVGVLASDVGVSYT